MPIPSLIVTACLVLLAIAHSVLGEREILRPLFAAEWSQPTPRWAMERILRLAWHLTSFGWLALAAIAAGAPVGLTIGVFGVASGALVLVMLRGHLAWPLFLLCGAGGLAGDGLLPREGLLGFVVAGAVVAVGAALLHFYWAGGGRWGIEVAIPTRGDGAQSFTPPAPVTAGVGVALLTLAGLSVWVWRGTAPSVARWGLIVALVLLVGRAVGDGRSVGFSKSSHSTPFERWDDRLFTPLVVVLAFGAGGALAA